MTLICLPNCVTIYVLSEESEILAITVRCYILRAENLSFILVQSMLNTNVSAPVFSYPQKDDFIILSSDYS